MRKLTCLVVTSMLAGAAHGQTPTSQTARVEALAKAVPPLELPTSAATSATQAADIVRRAAATMRMTVSNEDIVVTLIELADKLSGSDRHRDSLRVGGYALELTLAGRMGPGLEFDSLSRTGGARYNLDDFDGAARDLDAARKAAARITPFDANSVANATANYAVVLDNAGRYREAEAAFRESIALRTQAAEQRPASIAIAWLSLGNVHKRMGRYDLAEEEYRSGLAMLERAGQTTARSYPVAIHNYGVLMGETGRDAEAVALYRRAIEITPVERRYLPSMVNSYTSLTASLLGLGRLDEAEAALRDAERAAAAKPEPDTATINVLSARANLSGRRGDTAAAERAAADALTLARKLLAPDQIRLAEGLITYSDALLRSGKAGEAGVAADEAAKISAGLSDRNPVKAVAQDTRAAALVGAGEQVAALDASRTAAEIQARRFADEGGRTPVPLQPEERGIIARRTALLWDAASANRRR